jgi:hypothetical protein
MPASPLLAPIVALVAWTTLFRIWMSVRGAVATRKEPDEDCPPQTPSAPNPYRAAMFEQPTRFYAIAFALVLLHADWQLNVWIAWAYVGFRAARDLVEATFNHARTRFYLFVGATICLAALIVHAVMALIHG